MEIRWWEKENLFFRRNMVVIQFVISITLIIGMSTVYKQMHFIQNRSLGFDKENVVILSTRGQRIAEGYDTFRKELMQNSQIISVSGSGNNPGDRIYSNTMFSVPGSSEQISIFYIDVDHEYVDTYKLELLAGRAFSKEFGTDTAGTLMLNKAAVDRIGWTAEEAAGNELSYFPGIRKVVGVVKDFNYRSARTKIEPLALVIYPPHLSQISVRIQPVNFAGTLKIIESKWKELFPGEQFEYSFLDDRIDQLYQREKKTQNIFVVFSASIFISCLGLFGLAAFTAETRTKEIGIRKVLGATTQNAIMLLSKDVVKWIIIANVIAWPVGWYIMDTWLQNFAYQVEVGWPVFIMAFMITLIISLTTYSFQALKAAYANPVDSIKYQ